MSVSFFFEMAWKSGLIAGLALLLALLLRSRAAADRTALFRIAICLLLALPVISMLLPAIPLEIAAATQQVPPLLLPAASPADMASLSAAMPLAPAPTPSIWDDPSELVLLLYIGGLLMVGGRLVVGMWTLGAWTREADPVLSSEWTEALERARADVDGAAANVRLLVSPDAESPLSWGWRRPVILLDTDSCHMTEEADAILAHEMAHVARGDWLTLVIARLAVALFWFNPLVWLIERWVMEDAEEAADCHALKRVEPTRYAQILVHFARLERSASLPANSIASGGLARRIDAILSGDLVGVRTGSMRSLAAMAASVAIATPVAALQLTAPAPEIAASPLMQLAAAATDEPFVPVDVDVDVSDNSAFGDEAPVPPAPPQAVVPPVPPAPVADLPPVPDVPAPRAAPAPPAAPAAPAPRAFVTVNARANPVVVKVHHDTGWEEDFERAMERASREIERANEHAAREAERATAAAQREMQRAQVIASRNFAMSMEQGAKGMERGADGMDRGAQKMWDEAQRLKDRDYRERKIAEAATRGKRLTHEQLIDMIEGLEDGSRDMKEGAADMRREAAEMRSQRYEGES